MKNNIRHSGAVNREARFTFQLAEIRHAAITVIGDTASLRVEVSETELRDIIAHGQAALEEARLRVLYENGELTAEVFEEALMNLAPVQGDREGA